MKRWFKHITIAVLAILIMSFGRLEGPGQTEVAENDDSENLFLSIHKNIILGTCALPACHDGNFEPNFLTPQSTYYTTVMQDVLKISRDKPFSYRVVPFDTTQSVLYQRITDCCFVDEMDRMPILMETLNEDQLDSIATWIMLGAPDWKGEFPYQK